MITNATLTSIASPAAADKFGDRGFGPAAVVSARCALDEVRHSQRITLEAAIKDATAVLYVQKTALGERRIGRGDELRVTVDGGSSQAYVAEHVIDRVKDGGLSHWQVFLKERR